MSTFDQEANQLLDKIGGAENIVQVTHCATRLRFVLKDPRKAQVEIIKQMPIVKGVVTQSGQFQVIIGNEVARFYQSMQQSMQLEVAEDSTPASISTQTKWQQGMAFLAEIFAPLIPMIILGGTVIGIRNFLAVLESTNVITSLGNLSIIVKEIDQFLRIPATVIFQLLPVGMVWSVTKKMGTTQILGIILGLCLVVPQFSQLTFQGMGITVSDYSSQILPAIFGGWILGFLERWLRRIVPEAISMIVVPLCAFLPAFGLTIFVVGPVLLWLGHLLSGFMIVLLTGVGRTIVGSLFGALYIPLVLTGFHHVTNIVDLQLQADYGGTGLWPTIALANIAQGSAALGIWWVQRKRGISSKTTLSAVLSCYLGVTEPALFGVNVKYGSSFVSGIIGAAIAGGVATSVKVTASTIGVGGLPGILVIQPQSMMPFLGCIVLAMVLPFVCTLIFEKKQLFVKQVKK